MEDTHDTDKIFPHVAKLGGDCQQRFLSTQERIFENNKNSQDVEVKQTKPTAAVIAKTGAKAAIASASGIVMAQASRHTNGVRRLPAGVIDRLLLFRLQRRIGDPRSLPKEIATQIAELYEQVELWHGTGRYQYVAGGRNQNGDKNEDIVDVFDSICRQGQLTPAVEKIALQEQKQNSISLAPERMYARSYADMHAFKPNEEPRFGSSHFWANAYVADSGVRWVYDYQKFNAEKRNKVYKNSVGDTGVDGWAKKVRKNGLSISPPSAESLKNMSVVRQGLNLVVPAISLTAIYREGSDISENYPIVFGVRKGEAKSVLSVDKAIALHEVRVSDALTLAKAISHVEVPRKKIAETKQILEANGVVDIPILAIEDCEAYLARLTIGNAMAHNLVNNNRVFQPYEVSGPNLNQITFDTELTAGSEATIGTTFNWDAKTHYAAGLIPVRLNEKREWEVLMLKRSRLVLNGNINATPGGSCMVSKDKNTAVSAIRETREELGCPPVGKISLTPLILKDSKANHEFHGYVWLVDDKAFKPKLNWENTEMKWLLLASIEPNSPKLLGQCGALLRHLTKNTPN